MRIHKPRDLAFLYKVLDTERGMLLTATFLAAFPLDAPRPTRLLPEAALWAEATGAMDPGIPFEWSFPKPEAEFLVYGSFYSPKPVQEADIRVTVAERTKTLRVFGDRTAHGERVSDPAPMTVMPIRWKNAYGGPDTPDNPLGKGQGVHPAPGGHTDADAAVPWPNVMPAGSTAFTPPHGPDPAGLTALGPMWPARRRHLGAFDADWLADRWPYHPAGSSIRYSLTAPEDQRLGRFFIGDEAITVENMHPSRPRIDSALPGLCVRFFLKRRADGREQWSERPTKADTLWLFPDREIGVLAWRNLTLVKDEDLCDVAACLMAVEPLAGPRKTMDEYLSTLAPPAAPARKAAPPAAPVRKAAAPAAPAAAPVAPAPAGPGDAASPPAPAAPSPGLDEIEKAVADLKAQTEARLAAMGLTPEQVLARFPEEEPRAATPEMGELIDDFIPEAEIRSGERIKRIEKAVAALTGESEAILARLGLTPEKAEAALAAHAAAPPADPLAALDEMLGNPALAPEARAGLTEARAAMAGFDSALKAATAQAGPEAEPTGAAAKTAEPEPAPEAGERPDVAEVMRRHAAGKSLARLDLRGLDFTGRNLSGADLSGCRLDGAVFAAAALDGANLSKARLDGANFSGAGARKADFSGAHGPKSVWTGAGLAGAGFGRADLAEADLSGADLTGADLSLAVLRGAKLAGLSGAGCAAVKADLSKADLSGAILSGADLSEADLTGARLDKANLSGLTAPRLRLSGAAGQGVVLSGARLVNARAGAATDLAGADFRHADLSRAVFAGARLAGADFRRATLHGADLSLCDLSAARLRKADAARARLDKADLSRADLSKLNLFRGSLRKARLVRASCRKAGFYGADLYKCVVNETDLTGADLARTVLDLEAFRHGH